MEPPAHVTVNDEGCWITKGGTYQRRWERAHGKLPKGLTLDHECHNIAARAGTCDGGDCRHRKCENLDHLILRTYRENTHASPLSNASATHCPQGHEYTPENTTVREGKRYCKACAREYQRELRRKRAAARDMERQGRCINGHERTPLNTYQTNYGGLGCTDCQKIAGSRRGQSQVRVRGE